jgi:hypothetical protein
LAEKVASVLQTPKPAITVNGTPSSRTYSEYRWYRDGTLIPEASASTCAATQAGVYKVAVKLSADTDDVIVSDAITVSDANVNLVVSDKASNIPVQDASRIKVVLSSGSLSRENAEDLTFSLFDIYGKLINKTVIRNSRENIDMANLANGIYLYSVGTLKGKILK